MIEDFSVQTGAIVRVYDGTGKLKTAHFARPYLDHHGHPDVVVHQGPAQVDECIRLNNLWNDRKKRK